MDPTGRRGRRAALPRVVSDPRELGLAQSAAEPMRGAYCARVLGAARRVAEDLDDRALARALAASNDFGVLLATLEQPEALAALVRDDPLASARVRGLAARRALLEAEGGALTTRAVAALLRITPQAVDKRRRAGRLIGVAAGRRGYAYPGWQFGDDGLLPGLADVLVALAGVDPWSRLGFLLGGNARLGGDSPLAALRRGDVAAAVAAARAYGEHGAA